MKMLAEAGPWRRRAWDARLTGGRLREAAEKYQDASVNLEEQHSGRHAAQISLPVFA
jgi:hypothetical protein